MAAFGSPVLDSRMKYGAASNGPLDVTVQPLTDRCQSSATARQTCALAVSWLASASSAAEISPAISAAIVEGEYPPCSSHRSGPKLGPWLITKLAPGLMCCWYRVASVMPSWCAINSG